MNLVEQVARMLDREGAYSEWYDGTSGRKREPTTRQKYFKASYEHLAVDLLKMFMSLSKDEIRRELIQFEKDGWRRLGVPIDDPKIREEAHAAIERKYV